jgi:hypothetical protein
VRATPRRFLYAAVLVEQFKIHELLDMACEKYVVVTLNTALRYIVFGSIIILPSEREPCQNMSTQLAAVRASKVIQGIESDGRRP